jgi:hypothetical protein
MGFNSGFKGLKIFKNKPDGIVCEEAHVINTEQRKSN